LTATLPVVAANDRKALKKDHRSVKVAGPAVFAAGVGGNDD